MKSLETILNCILIFIMTFLTQAQGTTIMNQNIPISTSQLRRFDSSFFHHVEALSALEAGYDHFNVSKNDHSTEGWNFSK